MTYEITFTRFTEYLDVGPITLVTREWADTCSIIQCWSFTQPFAYARGSKSFMKGWT